jgi:hypothetical protein
VPLDQIRRSRGGGTDAGECLVGALRLEGGSDAEADQHDDGGATGDLRILLEGRDDRVGHWFVSPRFATDWRTVFIHH